MKFVSEICQIIYVWRDFFNFPSDFFQLHRSMESHFSLCSLTTGLRHPDSVLGAPFLAAFARNGYVPSCASNAGTSQRKIHERPCGKGDRAPDQSIAVAAQQGYCAHDDYCCHGIDESADFPPGMTKGRGMSGFLRRSCQAARTVITVVATRTSCRSRSVAARNGWQAGHRWRRK